MERLQNALEKARSKRSGTRSGRSGSAPQAIPSSVEEAWLSLPELQRNLDLWKKKRLVAAIGGSESSSYDLLRTKLLRICRENGWTRIAVVSPAAAAGKSTTMTNLAFSFARQKDVRAMLCDFDMRRPTIAKLLGHTVNHTMGDVLSGDVAFADHAVRYGMNLIFGLNRSASRHSSELLQSRDTVALLDELETTYQCDMMLFDMPPLLMADDAHGFLRNVDAAIIVMEAERTPIKQIDIVERQVAELTNVAGIVLNKCNYPDSLYGSGYNYYNY